MTYRKLTDIFIVPPISVLDVKQKYWKERRKFWLAKGIKGELGRNNNLLKLSSLLQKKQKNTSIFDPVLCEIMYLWFSKKNDLIYDPFSGGSVRGVVASLLERNYYGVDLRGEQVAHNYIQANTLCLDHFPIWEVGNSTKITIDSGYDLLFTCPPYYNLERYSNNENDLSNMSIQMFDKCYEEILTLSLSKLNENRFAVIVVGDIRGDDGNYLRLPQKTIEIFERCGCKYYNDVVLLQEPATAAMRAFKYMNTSRKIAKSHQNVLVFVKGDAKKATNRMECFNDKIFKKKSDDVSPHLAEYELNKSTGEVQKKEDICPCGVKGCG